MQFTTLTSAIVLALALVVKGSPTGESFTGYQTLAEFNNWLATTDADITFVGEPIDKARGVTLESRSALNTIVTYCSTRSGSICGGTCTVYNGGATCLAAPGTNCLSATHNVAFCDRGGCGGSCNNFANCGTRLDNGYCWTPGTSSINVGNA
ncbi:hypothetical protein H0H93_015269 [Arthromyces matolae]|nr:hypothetical protein H0H93_006700 [Arthromyces matolae]KAG6819119.1 hypothetical protein H0H93_015269 [Arthromyces matolae]